MWRFGSAFLRENKVSSSLPDSTRSFSSCVWVILKRSSDCENQGLFCRNLSVLSILKFIWFSERSQICVPAVSFLEYGILTSNVKSDERIYWRDQREAKGHLWCFFERSALRRWQQASHGVCTLGKKAWLHLCWACQTHWADNKDKWFSRLSLQYRWDHVWLPVVSCC